MSKRLQVVMEEAELRRLRRAAKADGVTMSEWVRRALRDAVERTPRTSARRKLETIRAAAQYDFPAPDMDQMNAEIARGYASGWEP